MASSSTVSVSMASLLQETHRQQHPFASQAAPMLSGANHTDGNHNLNILPQALEEEVERRKAVQNGTPYSVTKQFPWRLHEMLDLVEEEGLEEIVSFLPDGRSFKVHDSARFEKGLMRKCFNQTRYKSFQRQLNLWGFVRGNDPVYKIKGTYSHPWFIRGRKDLTPLIVRVGGAGNKNKTDVLYREVEAMKAKRQQPVLPKPLSGDKRTKNFQYVETEDKLSAVVVQSKGDDLADAATSLASFHKSGSPATVPPLNTDAPKLTNETRLSRTGMMPNKMAKMDHFYANFSSKATPSPTTASTASFLNTFQKPLPLGLSLGSAGAEDTSNNPMSSVLSALSRAEVIGSLSGAAKMDGSRSGVTGGEATDVTSNYIQRLHELRAAVATHSALLEEAIKISSERKLSIPATDNFPCLDVVEAKRQNKISATDCSLAVNGSVNSHELLQHLLRQQQHQDAQVPATASTVRDIASKKNMQGSNIENMDHQRMLQLLLAGSSTGMLPSSFIMSGLNGMAAGPYSLGNINTSSSILTEELRLEKGIQTLMRERVRLEAAAILESRQQRRRQLELYARSCL